MGVLSNAIVVFVLGLVTFFAAWWLTGLVRRYALNRNILDVPGERSSHTEPTPRGGGLAIVVVVLVGIGVGTVLDLVTVRVAIALSFGAVAVGWIGWVDDRVGVSPLVRALVHLLAAAWVVYLVGGLPELRFGTWTLHLGPAGAGLGVIGIIWTTNLFNFMDGADGIASIEAVVVGLVGGGLLWISGATGLALVAFIIACASAGFLQWNWPPAKIFMGDVGSGVLGFMFGGIAVVSEQSGTVPLIIWIMLLGLFVFDATTTLLRRVVRGERWYDAHRSHAYQRLLRAGWTHRRLAMFVVLLNVVLVFLAVLANQASGTLVIGLLGELILLILIYWRVERAQPMFPR